MGAEVVCTVIEDERTLFVGTFGLLAGHRGWRAIALTPPGVIPALRPGSYTLRVAGDSLRYPVQLLANERGELRLIGRGGPPVVLRRSQVDHRAS